MIREGDRIVRAFPGSGEQVRLAPGETVNDSVSIDDQFDLSDQGNYRLQLERADSATKALIKSNIVAFTVAK